MTYDEELAQMNAYGAEQDAKRATAPTAAQGSPEWLAERLGHCTCSRFVDVLDFTKAGKEGAKRAKYRMELVVERLTGQPVDHYVSKPMEWGTEQEPYARIAYEAATGRIVSQVGFVHHTEVKWCGGSADGLVDEDGLIEIKAPNSTTHAMTLLTGVCEHLPQIQGLLWICKRKWADYVSFDPRMPDGLKLRIERIERNDDYIAELAGNVLKFLAEVDEVHQKLLALRKKDGA